MIQLHQNRISVKKKDYGEWESYIFFIKNEKGKLVFIHNKEGNNTQASAVFIK